MASITSFKMDLEHSGPGPNRWRLSATLEQVPPMVGVEGCLKTVVHGQTDADENCSEPATLIAAHFHFHSTPGGPRFRKVSIDLVPIDPLAVAVIKVAPDGYFTLYPDDQGNKGHLQGFDISNPHYMETSNSAAWTITENSAQEIGFPSELTVATLLERQGNQPFVLELVVTTVIRRGKDDSHHKIALPIHFDPKGAAIGLDTLLPGTNVSCLSKVNIANLCQIGPIDSRETLRVRGYCSCGLAIL